MLSGSASGSTNQILLLKASAMQPMVDAIQAMVEKRIGGSS